MMELALSSGFARYEPRGANTHRNNAPDDLSIEPARAGDLHAVARLTADRDGGEAADRLKIIQRQFDDPSEYQIFVARVNGRVVGFGRVMRFIPPSNAPANTAPEGWYLAGIIVDPAHRRCGIGQALTQHRIDWLARRTDRAYYFANAENSATIDLHRPVGFAEISRDFTFPGAAFSGQGVGILFRVDLPCKDPLRMNSKPTFNLQPTLTSDLIELRPMREDDFDALYAVASDPLIWEQHPFSNRYQPAEFRAFFDKGMASGGALVVIDRATGSIIGSSRFHPHDEQDGGDLEIGWTFLARSHWGGTYNREMKRLMLEHAFKYVDRVMFLVGVNNIRSQRAMEKIGGVRAGQRDIEGGLPHFVYNVDRAALHRMRRPSNEE